MRNAVLLLLVAIVGGCTTLQSQRLQHAAVVGMAFTTQGEVGNFAEGMADPVMRRPVSVDDPVRVASVSKMVTAIGVMRLVDEGKLDLSSDVSKWLGWPLRNPKYPDRPITLSMLLAHTSSVREHDDDYVIPLGTTLEQVMRDPRNWDDEHPPGTYFSYVNLNYPIIASVMEKVTGQRFDLWMQANVLRPMNVEACFNWATCSDDAVTRAVELDKPDGTPVKDDLHGHRPACPVLVKEGVPCDLSLWRPGENGALFAPQGGLRISVRGLARIGRMILGRGTIDGTRILSPEAVTALTLQVWEFDGHNGQTDGGFYCAAGNGTHRIPNRRAGCADDLGTSRSLVGHAGDAYNMKSGLWVDQEHGRGITYFVTGVPDPAPRAKGVPYSVAEVAAFRRSYSLLPR